MGMTRREVDRYLYRFQDNLSFIAEELDKLIEQAELSDGDTNTLYLAVEDIHRAGDMLELVRVSL